MPETPEEMKERIASQKVKGNGPKVKPLEDYDPNKPKPVVSPSPSPSPNDTEDADEPTRDKFAPGLGGIAAYNAALKKYRADKNAKKAGQVKAMKAPAE